MDYVQAAGKYQIPSPSPFNRPSFLTNRFSAVKDAERGPITIGGIISFLEQRQQALLKDLDRSSTTAKLPPVSRSNTNTTTKSPTPTDRRSPAASDTTAAKRRKSPPAPITVDKMPSPVLSSLPLRACGYDNPSWTQHAAIPSWPDVSLVQPAATIPVEALPLVVGSKRKREALLDVDLTNGTRPYLNISRKRKSRNLHHGHPLSTGPRFDDRMDTDDEGRERKRVARRV